MQRSPELSRCATGLAGSSACPGLLCACGIGVHHALRLHAAVSDMPFSRFASVVMHDVQLDCCSGEAIALIALPTYWQYLTPIHVVQEAAAAGVKVVDAKRILKLMQALETALTHNAADGSLQYQSLRTRIEAAEQVSLKPMPSLA